MNQSLRPNTTWDANLYQDKYAFVWHYGAELIEILSPQKREQVLDLGCGTGQLTHQIAQMGAIVTGIDHSPTMIAQAAKNYPDLQFRVADGANFSVETPFDAVFSNAALHWIKDSQGAIRCIWQALRTGGRFVAEFGGKGNVEQIVSAFKRVLTQNGYPVTPELNPWYFPSVGEYAILLEQQGFEVTYATLFERPTQLEEGEQGIQNWIEMFGKSWLLIVPEPERAEILQQVEAQLKTKLYRDQTWFADYKRLRIVAIKL
ncbi:class I SAM-dependent methyltransferase [Gloeothece verrucosa]|uniref:Methyltransferase type 11 n=1 Tax=Gloeothece verrucosa (strain PCC 7822) TaxID=497965 RepID=E0UGB6_GLOV7|nr:class I SAM-dependent methyltransferase [Gloeothece verrucosa]ADN16735.1 Methyltransferase type 11 [Gloeothece verrucosa PCC 7822]